MKKIFTIVCMLLGLSAMLDAQTPIGYTNGEFDKKDGVRIGASQKQGAAVKFSKEKSKLLKGKKIVGVRAVFGTRQLSNLNFFITKKLGAEPLLQQAGDGGSTSWKNYTFSKPFVLEEETEFYVGYTVEAGLENLGPLAFDRSGEVRGLTWYYSDENKTWTDLYGNGLGNINLQLLVEDMESFTDLSLKSFLANGYYKVGNPYEYVVQVFNFGTQPITGFDVNLQIGDDKPVTYSYSDLNIEAAKTYDISLPAYMSSDSGSLPVKIAINNINGADDSDMSDNVEDSHVFIYPLDVEKKLLLEGFTGQDCGNCPSGHQIVNKVVKDCGESVIEVFHHSGYYADDFTMMEDGEYTWFYNGETNSAPAAMLNRLWDSDSGFSGPIFNTMNATVLANVIGKAAAIQPYVSVDINNKFNEETRELKTTVKVHTYVEPESEINTLNIFIVQDSIIAYQASGGNNYVHRYAFRGALLNPWGVSVTLKAGEDLIREYSYILPDEILSTYASQTSIPTELKNMHVVAFVSAYSADNANACGVYNCNSVKFTESTFTVSIDEEVADKAPFNIHVNGNTVDVQGDYTRLDVYDMTGKRVKTLDNSVESFDLPQGFYIVSAISNGKIFAKKVTIMK